MKVKICGITNIEDALFACELGADAIGFIFYKNSRRFIEYEKAKSIVQSLPSFVLKVGVFVNEDSEIINKVSNEVGLNIIQLHGEESPEFINEIKLPVWKVFRVHKEFDFDILKKYKNCDFMFDTFSKESYGGTGEIFDWNIIPTELRNKIILAGGISANNIEEIYNYVSPAWVDVSSSLEKCPGKKDEIKLKEFFDVTNKLRKY